MGVLRDGPGKQEPTVDTAKAAIGSIAVL